MQKTAKKFLSMLLALMMVLSILPTAVFATEQGTVAAPLDSIVPYGANDQTTGTATISVQNPVTFTGYSAFENVPYYLVTVPAGTTYVKATYKDAAILTNATSGVASGYYADVPQWTGGGVVFAPVPRDYEVKMNKKERRAALKSALTSKVQDNKLVVVDSLALAEVKTKEMQKVLTNLKAEKALVITADNDQNVVLSARNIADVETATPATINTYDVMKHNTVVVTKDAVASIEEVYA